MGLLSWPSCSPALPVLWLPVPVLFRSLSSAVQPSQASSHCHIFLLLQLFSSPNTPGMSLYHNCLCFLPHISLF